MSGICRVGSRISVAGRKKSNCSEYSACSFYSLSSMNTSFDNEEKRKTSTTSVVTTTTYQPQDDEKSLCASELSGDFSLDNPSYGSIILQIQEANVEADGTCDFIWKAFEIIGNTLLITVLLGIFMALPVAMISVGVKYLHECPREPKIPIYLLVGGCFGLLKLLSLLWKQVKSRRYERLDEIYDTEEDGASGLTSKSSTFTDVVLSLFLFIWFVFGNYWVISVWEPNYKQLLYEPSNWCDKTVYLFAFSQIMACYCLMVLIAFCICILTLCHRYTVMFEKS
ncbi:transmembrane protein 272-like isoform X3 [Lineus longissimus]|uniref:transmembrane protein 272-like isoform X3 n=1 Tax=Lineus longissimus TaxID=88925 RepID=UPI002B4DDEF2